MAAWTAIGPSMGIGIGVAIGAALEQKHKHETRPLTEKERQIQKWAMLIGLLLAALGILVLVDVLVLTSLR
jgi:predicted nucleic acid-binding Zn ribbon protein